MESKILISSDEELDLAVYEAVKSNDSVVYYANITPLGIDNTRAIKFLEENGITYTEDSDQVLTIQIDYGIPYFKEIQAEVWKNGFGGR